MRHGAAAPRPCTWTQPSPHVDWSAGAVELLTERPASGRGTDGRAGPASRRSASAAPTPTSSSKRPPTPSRPASRPPGRSLSRSSSRGGPGTPWRLRRHASPTTSTPRGRTCPPWRTPCSPPAPGSPTGPWSSPATGSGPPPGSGPSTGPGWAPGNHGGAARRSCSPARAPSDPAWARAWPLASRCTGRPTTRSAPPSNRTSTGRCATSSAATRRPCTARSSPSPRSSRARSPCTGSSPPPGCDRTTSSGTRSASSPPRTSRAS